MWQVVRDTRVTLQCGHFLEGQLGVLQLRAIAGAESDRGRTVSG